MSTARLFLAALLLAALALGAGSRTLAADRTLDEYFEFRTNSTLPGMLFGVTPQGEVGFDGALQQNIPVAYTPKGGNVVVGGSAGSKSRSIQIGTNAAKSDGTAFLGVGLGGGKHPGYVSWEATSNKIEECFNGQIQVLAGHDTRPAIAVGVQDAGNERQRFIHQNAHNARSVYATATGAFSQATWRPIYWTLGLGNGRFRRGFAGVSVPFTDHLKLVAEYDSFNPNLGLAFGVNGHDTDRHWELLGYAGLTDLKYPLLGLTATFN